MGFIMKVGDLVQSNLFDERGSGGYGLVTSKHPLDDHWVVQWCSEGWELSYGVVGAYEIHEKDLVVVSRA